MESLKKIKENIKPELGDLEEFRRLQYRYYKVAYLGYIFPLLLFGGGVFYALNIKSHIVLWPCMIVGILSIRWIDVYLLEYFRKKYVKKVKASILYGFINVIYPKGNFDSKRMIDIELFKKSQLYGVEFISYKGEDYFEGTTELGVKYQFSEIRASYNNNNKFNKGQEHFEGFIYILEMPNFYCSGVKIFSKKKAPSYYRRLDDIGNLSSVQVERISPSLNKKCKVYNEEEGEAGRLLNRKLIDVLESIINAWSDIFRISFYGNKVFIALDAKDFFCPKIHEGVNEKQFLERIYGEIKKCFHVVESVSDAFETIDKSLFIEKEGTAPQKLTGLDDNTYDHLIDF